jgi:hypothetical protein
MKGDEFPLKRNELELVIKPRAPDKKFFDFQILLK